MKNHDYPNRIAVFDITNRYSGVGFEEAYYKYQDFSIKIYKTKTGFAYGIVHITPRDVFAVSSGVKNLVQECINDINEWCFLNDHLFRPAE